MASSQIAQGGDDGQASGAERGKEAANQADQRCPKDALNQQTGRDHESKSHLAKALPIHGRGLQTVEGEVGQERSDAASSP